MITKCFTQHVHKTNFINKLICFAWLNTMRCIHVELIQGMSLKTFIDLPCYIGQSDRPFEENVEI